jgi:hypothetical protein
MDQLSLQPAARPKDIPALGWAKRGIKVFPCLNSPGESTHKAPLTPHGFKDATTDPAIIAGWWTRWPDALIGMPTGLASGFDIIDIDRKNGKNGTEAIPDWEQRSPVIAQTVSNGLHLWFRSDGTLRCGKPFDGVDLKAEGGYVIVPPSEGYSWLKEGDLTTLPDFPSDLRPQPYEPRPRPEHDNDNDELIDPDRLRVALSVIDADDRDTWVSVGIALYNELGDDGEEMWAEWVADF